MIQGVLSKYKYRWGRTSRELSVEGLLTNRTPPACVPDV